MHILEFAAERPHHARGPAPAVRQGAASGDHRRAGMVRMAALGQACGPVSPLLPAALAAASLFLPAPA